MSYHVSDLLNICYYRKTCSYSRESLLIQWRIQKFWKGVSTASRSQMQRSGAQPPAAEEVSIFKSTQSNEKFNIFPIDNSKLWLATLTYSS